MLRTWRYLAVGLVTLLSAATSVVNAQSIPFSETMVLAQMVRGGVSMNAKLAVIGVPKGDLQTSPAQRDAIDAKLSSVLPPDFRYLSRNQLIRVANLIGSGDRVSDDIWANIQSDAPDVVGLVFFDPVSVQNGTAIVTPRIVLRDGQSIVFDPYTVPLPETAYEIRLDALLAQFANRLSGISPASNSLHVSFIQEGLDEPASSFRDCRNVLATRLKKEIASADMARLSSEHRAFFPEDKATLAVLGHLATEGETIFVGLEAPTIGLFEPIQSVKLGSSCILATPKPKCEHGIDVDGTCLSKRQIAANELPSTNTIPAWSSYLKSCKGCEFEELATFTLKSLERTKSDRLREIDLAKQTEVDEKSWQRAMAKNTAGAIRFYLSSCGSICAFRNDAVSWLKRHEQETVSRLAAQEEEDEKSWKRAQTTNTADGYRFYLSSCRNTCLHAVEASAKLSSLASGRRGEEAKLQEQDERNWKYANQYKTASAILSYLRTCTVCTHRREAAEFLTNEASKKEAEIAKLRDTDGRAWDAANRKQTIDAYKVYVATCVGPCAHKSEAERIIRQKETQADLAKKAAERADDRLWDDVATRRNGIAANNYLAKCSPCRHERQAQSIVAIGKSSNTTLKAMLSRSKKDTSGASQYALCTAFEQGRGIPKNLFFHVPWCEEAASYNHAQALDYAGSAYMYGKGVARDYSKASTYLTRGMLLGNRWAGYHLSELYRDGKGVPKDLETAQLLSKQFIDHFYANESKGTNMHAYFVAATLYRDGFGVHKDLSKARELFEKAKKYGHPFAQSELNKIRQ